MLRFTQLSQPEEARASGAAAPPATVASVAHPLDGLTAGVFSAPTSGERGQRVRAWLATSPTIEQIQEVYRELSTRDKGAARPLKERLDEWRRAREQETIATEWASRAESLIALPRLNIADALAWQRDAARAGAPLSREPLAGLKARLAERVRQIEDLQHRVQVQREAAVLLAQRVEVLSTRSWLEAQTAWEPLRADVAHWQAQTDALVAEAEWPAVDPKFPPQIEAARVQLLAVWEAFQAALAQAVAAAGDESAALPAVPVWAEEIRSARGLAAEPGAARPQKPKVDPEQRAAAVAAVRSALDALEQELAAGHGKASVAAANALRVALRDHARLIDDRTEAQAQTALAAAGELEGWQRWRADQIRRQLVARAEGLFEQPPAAQEGQEPGAPRPRFGGRRMQEALRELREQWKATDSGGPPNHALWRRFDAACNEAYKVVQAWLDKIRAEEAAHRAQRQTLLAELQEWTATHASDTDWRAQQRDLQRFAQRWRDAGHLGEKAFAEMQAQWRQAMQAASAPLHAQQQASVARREALIEEARVLGAAPVLRIDAVRALQQRWQQEAQALPLDRHVEQKLWDAFRKPIDEAFERKSQERERAAQALGAHDRAVMDAARAVEAANASGDATRIRAALQALESAVHGHSQEVNKPLTLVNNGDDATKTIANAAGDAASTGALQTSTSDADPAAGVDPEAPGPAPRAPARPVVAVRGDDRPGQKKATPAAAAFGRDRDRRGGRVDAAGARAGGFPGGARPPSRDGRGDREAGSGPWRGDREARPRLGDAAFRAQREAVEHAQQALRKLTSQAHGEALTRLLEAWALRDAQRVPPLSDLGRSVSPSVRAGWVKAIAGGVGEPGDQSRALLRLEMAAEVPTPAAHLDARRALQLQLLTRRHDPAPAQTWGEDAAVVFAGPHEESAARRLQTALKALLR